MIHKIAISQTFKVLKIPAITSKLPKRQIFPSKGCKIWCFFLLGRITFVGGNSPFPIVGFFISIHPIMRSVNGKSTLALHLSPSLSWRKLNSPTFFFGAPGAMPKPSWTASYRCRDRPNFPPFPTSLLQPKTWVDETMESPVKICLDIQIWPPLGDFFWSQHL